MLAHGVEQCDCDITILQHNDDNNFNDDDGDDDDSNFTDEDDSNFTDANDSNFNDDYDDDDSSFNDDDDVYVESFSCLGFYYSIQTILYTTPCLSWLIPILKLSRSISAVTVMGICEPHGLIKRL